MPPVIYGTEGIRQRSYAVYMADLSLGALSPFHADGDGFTELQDLLLTLTSQDYATAKTKLDAFLALAGTHLHHVGEMRKDSIDASGEKGDTVEGNEVGEIVLGKACSFSAELINATPANLGILHAMDSKPVLIVLLEVDSHVGAFAVDDYTIYSQEAHEMIILGRNASTIATGDFTTPTDDYIKSFAHILNTTEKDVGGGIIVATINLAGSYPTLRAFRHIFDVPYDLMDIDHLANLVTLYEDIDVDYLADLNLYTSRYNTENSKTTTAFYWWLVQMYAAETAEAPWDTDKTLDTVTNTILSSESEVATINDSIVAEYLPDIVTHDDLTADIDTGD